MEIFCYTWHKCPYGLTSFNLNSYVIHQPNNKSNQENQTYYTKYKIRIFFCFVGSLLIFSSLQKSLEFIGGAFASSSNLETLIVFFIKFWTYEMLYSWMAPLRLSADIPHVGTQKDTYG